MGGGGSLQFKMTTDHAIRCMLYLASSPRRANSQEIGEATGVDHKYLLKILGFLRKAGLVHATQGDKGGFVLAKPAKQITMMEVIRPVEKTIRVSQCLDDDAYGHRDKAGFAPMLAYYTGLQRIIEDYLNSVTLQELLDQGYDGAFSVEGKEPGDHYKGSCVK